MKPSKKSAPAPAPAPVAKDQPAKQCRAAEVGHRSCGCPACDHNAKRK